MQDLRVVGAEEGALLLASDRGERFRVRVDDSLHSHVRKATPQPRGGNRVSPKQIQAHIRSGMSAQDVAALTGAELEYVQRFEGPVLAEREYVVESALAVPVHTAADPGIDPSRTFGNVIRNRLHELGAVGERWASWKEPEGGWIVKLAFTVDHIDHDARWQFEPKTQALAPLGAEAESLSQQESIGRPLLPRLRAVTPTEEHARFDSDAFVLDENPGVSTRTQPFPVIASTPSEPAPTGNTADLLEALRRRRGEREPAGYGDIDEAKASHPASGGIRLVDVPLDTEPAPEPAPAAAEPKQPTAPAQPKSGKRGRAAMPSWDEIVFGARPDDDLA